MTKQEIFDSIQAVSSNPDPNETVLNSVRVQGPSGSSIFLSKLELDTERKFAIDKVRALLQIDVLDTDAAFHINESLHHEHRKVLQSIQAQI